LKLVNVYLRKMDEALDLPIPSYMTEGSSGMDLYANIESEIVIKPGHPILVPTGIKIELPSNYEGQIRPRSGLALKHGITVLNSPGTIDSDYRGEIKVILINLGKKDFVITRKMRIAQLVIAKVWQAQIIEVEELGDSERGAGGFGHTGLLEDKD